MNYVFRFALVAASARLLWAYPMAVTDSRLLGFNTSHFVREIENIEGRQLLGGGLGLESTQTQTSTQTPTSIATRTLTLTQSTSTSTLATSNSFSHSPRTNAGTISAGVIGGVLVTAFVIALLFWLRIKRKVSQPGAQTLSQASGREKLPSSPPSIKSLAPEQVASEPSQNHFVRIVSPAFGSRY
ncbi:hypothetical protein F5887DRAFT_96549 [Amanita rubescens]|nr:hypothetical protein F5887DRAFT_96549 [Amanita rubescens]